VEELSKIEKIEGNYYLIEKIAPIFSIRRSRQNGSLMTRCYGN